MNRKEYMYGDLTRMISQGETVSVARLIEDAQMASIGQIKTASYNKHQWPKMYVVYVLSFTLKLKLI